MNANCEIEPLPRLSRSKMILAVVVYAIWLIFLGLMAAQRWFGVLQ